MSEIVKCKGCGEDILFKRTARGKLMPCDPDIHIFLTLDGKVRGGYIPHFVTCKKAKGFRKTSVKPAL
jgi:hypothetical protein